jgi:hypothetical protein
LRVAYSKFTILTSWPQEPDHSVPMFGGKVIPLEVIKGWAKPIRADFGIALNEMQEGRPATLAVRPMQSIGSWRSRIEGLR